MINNMQTRNYTVAGHTFCLQMETNSPLWETLTAYTPFETTGNSDEAEPIFTLHIAIDLTAEDSTAEAEEGLTLIGHFDSEFTKFTLFSTPQGGRLFVIAHQYICPHCSCHLRISADYRNAALTFRTRHTDNPATGSATATGKIHTFGLNNALMLLYAFTTATRNTVLAHASVVMNRGVAYAFLGRSGTGKSTHTGLWLKHIPGSELLNDDNPVVRIENGIARIYGSPWSGKTPCYRNLGAPLGGIVRLSQAPRNQIAPLKNAAAYAAISPSLSAMKWERHMADGIHDTLTQLIAATGVYHLQCLPDAAAAKLSAQTLQGEMSCAQ